MHVILTRKPLLFAIVVHVVGVLSFLVWQQILSPQRKSFVFESSSSSSAAAAAAAVQKKNESREGSSIPVSIIPPEAADDQHQIIETDSSHPLFYKDGLQKICSKQQRQHGDDDDDDDDDEDSIVESRKFWRPIHHTYQCLTVSQDGTTATLTTLNSSFLPAMLENGDAILFGAGIDQQYRNDEKWFYGRLMNRLIQLRNALSHSASCGKLMIIPKTLSYTDRESWGEFDCADFRRMGRQPPPPIQEEDVDHHHHHHHHDVKQNMTNSCSLVAPEENHHWFFYVPEVFDFIPDYKNRSKAAHMVLMAWWSLGPGYFRCQPCSESSIIGRTTSSGSGSDSGSSDDLNVTTIAWIRSGDVYSRRHRNEFYGQPPLEFYVQSVQHSGAKNVRFLSEDGMTRTRRVTKNPLVVALPNVHFGTEQNETGSSPPINVTLVLGEPFLKVLHQLFCARTVIVGVSTLSKFLTFSPNAKTIFLAKPWIYYSHVLEYGTADIYFYDVGLSDSPPGGGGGGDMPPFENNSTFLFHHSNTKRTNYSVYQNWTNSPAQRQEMISFQGGTLNPILLQNHSKNRNMT